MAVTENTYTGNGSTVLFSFTFPYLATTDIKVSINGTLTTAYTLANATTVQFNTAPANGAAIRIYRATADASSKATFFPGSSIRAQDLNDNFTQGIYIAQETANYAAATDASAIQATANTALANSNTAITTANAAEATANGIAGTANTALSNSTAAVSTANSANTTATAALPKAGGTMTGSITFSAGQPTGTTSTPGIVQLTDSTSSTSTTTAATPNSVKSAYDAATAAQTTASSAQATANAALPLAGGTLTGNVNVPSLNGGPLAGARNILINGDTRIDQRNGGAAVTLNGSAGYACDRWNSVAGGGVGTGTATVQRVVDAPAGFTTSLKWTTTNAKTPAAGDNFYCWQPIEGHNIDQIGFNTASAKALTLSFWVKSSLTGTFSGFCRQFSASATYRSFVFTYTISAANTWEYKTVSIAADPSSGFTPLTDSNTGLGILFDMGSGSTYETGTANAWQSGNYFRTTGAVRVISTLNATWQVTGVQLEIGSVATPFERRSYGQELALCHRYYSVLNNTDTLPVSNNAGAERGFFKLPVTMRTTPNCIFLYDGGSGAAWVIGQNGGYQNGNHSVASGFAVLASAEF